MRPKTAVVIACFANLAVFMVAVVTTSVGPKDAQMNFDFWPVFFSLLNLPFAYYWWSESRRPALKAMTAVFSSIAIGFLASTVGFWISGIMLALFGRLDPTDFFIVAINFSKYWFPVGIASAICWAVTRVLNKG
ncbi:MAG: hypothetical protein JST35_07475 [Armatimonadetes bacterium]|nr:hypothetical protein [Armatimonadota bacterium]